MRIPICLLLLIGLTTTPARADDRTYVLVWRDAFLHTAPRDDAPKARAEAWTVGRAKLLGWVQVFERLAEKGDWVQVTNVTDELPGVPNHCADPQWNLSSYRLALWVKRTDLAPVLMKTTTTQFQDGTAATVRAGAPVWPADGKLQRVLATGLIVSLSLPDDMVGTTYRPARRLASDFPAMSKKDCPGGFLHKDTELTIAGKRRVARSVDGYRRKCVANAEKVGKRHRVTLRSACLELTAWSSDPPEDGAGGTSSVLGALGGERPMQVKVRAGAPVRWTDGRLAGKTVGEVWFEPEQIEGDDPGCASISLVHSLHRPPKGEGDLTLCFDKADTQRARRPTLGDIFKGDQKDETPK